MNDRVPSDKDLDAYVDGELSPHERAQVAHAVAADPALAARVASLAALKSAVAGLADERPMTLGDLGVAAAPRRSFVPVIAAAGLGMLLAAAAGTGGYWIWRAGEQHEWLAKAKARHLAWTQEPETGSASGNIAQVLRAALHRFRLPALVPDMSGAKLTLTDVAYFHDGEGSASTGIQLRYTGLRGCRVSLWLSRGESFAGEPLVESGDGSSRGFYWRVAGVSYALFATGMDRTRLTLLARAVYHSTRENRAVPEERLQELRVASDAAAPCRA